MGMPVLALLLGWKADLVSKTWPQVVKTHTKTKTHSDIQTTNTDLCRCMTTNDDLTGICIYMCLHAQCSFPPPFCWNTDCRFHFIQIIGSPQRYQIYVPIKWVKQNGCKCVFVYLRGASLANFSHKSPDCNQSLSWREKEYIMYITVLR